MKVTVTQDDIKLASCFLQSERSKCCPIAQALKRITGKKVSVSLWSVIVGSQYGELPKEAREFIALYDTTKQGQPFEFEVILES